MNSSSEPNNVSNLQSSVRRYFVVGARRLSNYIWACVSGIGGLDFFLTGWSSYQHQNVFFFIHAENIAFFPQGLVMCFYGLLALLISFYIWLTILWRVGQGFNLFDLSKQTVRIFRWGFPGKNRRVDLQYNLNEIASIVLELKQGWNARRTIYLRLKNKQSIPLTHVGQPMTLEAIETLATEMAQFLQTDLIYTSV
jgi:Ycf4